ncbi:MAG TPA: hypothetical protein VFR93_00550 [Candidatus Limnocylindrales bacterium]|nr:hypothetical protein [Candidatus Limnocylindrales bacterium]
MQAVRERDVDDVDRRVGEECRERVVDGDAAVALGERRRSRTVAAGDRDQLAARIPVQRPDDPRRDPARPEDPPAQASTGGVRVQLAALLRARE